MNAASFSALSQLVHLQSGMLSHRELRPAATQFAADAAETFGCERVSIGIVRKGQVRLTATSHGSDEFRGAASAEIEAAMDECLDQRMPVGLPERPNAEPQVALAHAALLAHSRGAALSVPIEASGTVVGVLTLEWRRQEALARVDLLQLQHQLALVGPILALMIEVDQPLHTRMLSAIEKRWHRSPSTRLKIWLTIAIAATALLIWPFGQELSGRARVEAIAERSITAPQDGFIQAVHVRPGDRVEESHLLLELSAQDLQLDAQRVGSEVVKHESAYMAALVRSDRAQMAVNLADLQEAQAQLALSKSRLVRSRIESPIAGIVTDGDLTRSVGAPVKRGEILLTIAPGQGRRVIVQIDEQDIRHVQPGQSASLALSALPWDSLPMKIVRVAPLARTIDGANVFEVEALPEQAMAVLRPGMTGVARIRVGRESLAAYAARKVGNALRLCWWTFGF